jgi:DnaJ homolog subfamily C member 8
MFSGTAEEQVARLLQPNHQWKNLNPLEVLQLDVDATEDDVKLRYRKLSALVHPDKCQHLDNAREAFEEVGSGHGPGPGAQARVGLGLPDLRL